MKKTTKKLISIFLSLLMVLSLIPMGMMSASAAGSGNMDYATIGELINGEDIDDVCFSINAFQYYKMEDNTKSHEEYIEWVLGKRNWSRDTAIIPQQWLNSSTFIFKIEGKTSNTSVAINDTHTALESDPTICKLCGKEMPSQTCDLCVGCGHEESHHYGGHCIMCWSAESGSCESEDNYTACALEKGHSGDHSATAGPTHEHNSSAYGTSDRQHWTKCTDDEDNNGTPTDHTWSNGQCSVCNYACLHTDMTTSDAACSTCGKANPDYQAPATCGLCTECGHPWAKHDAEADRCTLCNGVSGCYDKILGEECVLDAGHDGNHDSWYTVTNTDDINAILTKVVGEYKDAEVPDTYGIKISGNATDGFSYVYNNSGTKINVSLNVVKQKGNEYFIDVINISEKVKAGFTFKFNSQGKLTYCYQVGYKIGESGISNYYAYPYIHVHTWDNGTCTLDGETCSHTGMTASDATCGTCGITNPSYVPPHTHTYATTWSKDATHHWHAATCDHTDQKSDYAQHSYSSEVTTPATCTSAGVTTYTCTCGDTYTDATTPAATGHKFATTWSSDENQHWYAATCGHESEKKDEANHTYGTEGDARFTCTVCSAVNNTKKLEFAKEAAKAAIDEYVGESTDADAIAIANKAKQDIDAATTVEDVNDIKAKALEDIKDIIAPDFATLAKDLKYDGTEVKLTKDYTRAPGQKGITIEEGQKVVIDLNGHKIDGADDNAIISDFIFDIYMGGELVINDSTDNKGVITGGNGYYSLSNSRRYGGAINNRGTTTINGGTFTNNSADIGGAINNERTLTINGGVFTDNIAYAQGGVINNLQQNAELLITGGTFTGNYTNYGGVVINVNGTMTIIGGTFTDNTAEKMGGGILQYQGTLNIGGSPVIKDNNLNEDTNNLEYAGGTIALDEETALTEDAEIGVTITAETDTLIAEGATLDMLSIFTPDDTTKMFIVEDGALKLENIADHKHSFGETGEDRYNCQTCGALDEEEKADVELADAKADALDAIKEAVGECEEKAVLDVAFEYYAAIDNAKTIEDVNKLLAEGIKAVNDAKHKHSYTSKVTTPATCTKDGVRTYTCSCGDTYTETIKKTGHKYTSKVTKAATYSAAGVRTYTCSNCGNKYTVAIPRLNITSTVKYNNSTKLDAGFKVTSSTKDITVKWGKVADADGYMVYANYCGNNTKPILIKTIKGADTKTYSFSKINGKKLDLNKNFKVYVVAYKTVDGKKVEFGKTITAHVVGGKNKTYTNPTKVTVKKDKVTLSVNKTSKISATVTYKYSNKKHLSDGHAAEKRYRSSNKAVATVDANGKITAVGKGTCTVYVFAKNGTSAKVTVTVK